ncbi:MAG TPA: hypothetical protein ENK53_08125 [Thiotrichales bacterium]|nr:hypothetical protein [Thiotrichales bacterium]
MAQGEFLVYRAWMLRTVAVVTVLLFVLGGWLLYEAGISQGRESRLALQAERERLQARVATLESRIRALEEEAVRLRRASEIDRVAVNNARARQAELEATNQELRRELHFYRSVMAPEKSSQGLEIREFTLRARADGSYRFQLLLVQAGRNDRRIEGRLRVTFVGRGEKGEETVPLARVSVKGRKDYPFRLKYFQAIEDVWRLPEGFRPTRIRFHARPRKGKAREWEYAWPEPASDREEGSDVETKIRPWGRGDHADRRGDGDRG